MTDDMRRTGTPCWLDLQTDVERAKAFYGAALGWTFTPIGPEFGEWCIARVDGEAVAGVGPGEPRPWQVFLHTDDIGETCMAARAAGGTVTVVPGDVGELGRAAQLRDPGGAIVGLWQPGTHTGFGVTEAPGAPAWFEVNTREGEAVRDFFAGLFDLSAETMTEMVYHTLHADGRPCYGVLQMTDAWEGIDPVWTAYFAVADADATLERVKAAGGAVLYGPFDTPFGRVAVCKDPMDTVFSTIQLP